jgi:hypothetical protein
LSKEQAIGAIGYCIEKIDDFSAFAWSRKAISAASAIPAARPGKTCPKVVTVLGMARLPTRFPETKFGHAVPGMPESLAETTFMVLGYSAAIP